LHSKQIGLRGCTDVARVLCIGAGTTPVLVVVRGGKDWTGPSATIVTAVSLDRHIGNGQGGAAWYISYLISVPLVTSVITWAGTVESVS